jgi:ABC-type multidrug transport system ATPase subunit
LALLEGRELVDGDPPDTLVFDEVDAGIGGQAATAVGLALAELAQGRQVLVVTHLPQVAAFADQQAVVAKDQQRARTVTTVTVVDEDERVRELARMLSGSPDSETAREHARELLRSSARRPHRVSKSKSQAKPAIKGDEIKTVRAAKAPRPPKAVDTKLTAKNPPALGVRKMAGVKRVAQMLPSAKAKKP